MFIVSDSWKNIYIRVLAIALKISLFLTIY